MIKLRSLFDTARKSSDFGNGRYVRNTIEKALLTQASRLVSMDYDKITSREITLITEDDIIIPEMHTPDKKLIGFAA